ncbi:Oidioi.mRNA.OKI2018_I69.chr1.g85.t2.cds [Oikopleura dioica]|uniref:Oidioi.mRNA.OKI2018_I69.chr1.g85.t2.cds n=1 Tax=Oikopleura dioica TaxID=34765 RepID=A0ABN7SNV5_OIKDI|nr:Oidioi.mRNA.OKI2018_I69.chr1.g85.t2.cds [Oikopleura dioica]
MKLLELDDRFWIYRLRQYKANDERVARTMIWILYVTILLVLCCQNNSLASSIRAYCLLALLKLSEITADAIFNSLDILAPCFLIGWYFFEAVRGMRLNLQSVQAKLSSNPGNEDFPRSIGVSCAKEERETQHRYARLI